MEIQLLQKVEQSSYGLQDSSMITKLQFSTGPDIQSFLHYVFIDYSFTSFFPKEIKTVTLSIVFSNIVAAYMATIIAYCPYRFLSSTRVMTSEKQTFYRVQ